MYSGSVASPGWWEPTALATLKPLLAGSMPSCPHAISLVQVPRHPLASAARGNDSTLTPQHCPQPLVPTILLPFLNSVRPVSACG